jgi:GNAT superfamily N-acetyltransferase
LNPGEVAEGCGAFLIAYCNGKPIGCGAVRKLDSDTAEIKRMYVAPEARGGGIGKRILLALEEETRRLGVRRLVLETGERQHEAMALYARFGFARIPAFGEYVDSPLSVCLGKNL